MQNNQSDVLDRCWVFGSTKPISQNDPDLAARLNQFMGQWASHGTPVAGRWKVLHEHFLIVLREPEGAEVSGCSIDSMKGEVKFLEQALKTDLMDSSRIFFRTSDGAMQVVSRQEFKNKVWDGTVTPDTEVFDTTLTSLNDLRPGVFSKPLRDSWHARLYENAMKARPQASA